MTRTGSPEAILANILHTLELKSAGSQERCDAYDTLSWNLTGNELGCFVQEVSKNITRLLKVIKDDVQCSPNDIKKKALQLLGTCIFDTEIVSRMGKTKCVEMLEILLHTINSTKEKSTCSIALWCLKSQNIDQVIIIEKAEKILTTVECAMEKWSTSSVSVVDGFIGTIERLTSQAPKEMYSQAYRWGKLLLPLIVNKAIQVREAALLMIENNLNTLMAVQKELVIVLKPVMKQKILPGLRELFKENRKMSVYVLKCWGTLVQFYGEELHNLSYVNEFMSVIELGFKSSEPPVKIAAFQAWQQLIDNFALNQTVIQDPKKISLIMQVFKHNNTRTESVALEKLSCWWHFLWLLGDKVSPNFELVVDPLLKFCVGGKLLKQSGAATPRSLNHASTQPSFKSLQVLGCEALAHFLGNVEDGRELRHKFKLDPFTHRIVSGPAFYIKHAEVLITAASQLCTSLGKATPESLALHSWEWMIAHLKTAIDSPGKLDIRKTLSTLLREFRVVVQSSALPNNILLVMFERLGTIQKRVLCSSAYGIHGEEMIHGTPAMFITRLLLSPTLLLTSSGLDSYHDTFSFLLENSSGNSTGTLGFLQSVMEILKENAHYIDSKETLWRLWSALEHLLIQHISKSNEINQGDSLEHDFGCSVQTLVFPVLQDLHELPQSLVKSMVKGWSELYKTVNRLAAMVANAEANIVCEEVCSQMLDHYLENDTVEATEVDMLAQMCRVVVNSLYFSSLGSQPVFRMSVSPKKFAKNRHKPLENIHSLVALLGLMQKKAVTLVPNVENFKKTTGLSLQTMLNNLVETFSTIFVHVTSSNVISNLIGQLGHPIGDLFADSHNKAVKVYNNSFQSKLEKLWLDICTCLQSRYTSLFDSDFLEKCAPLLRATFLHPRRQIKNQTMSLWACTFGKAAYLSYPESLKPVLSKVKAKTMIELPNWVATISPVIDETQVSQMTQMQAPEPHIPGMPSPHKIHGSFLNKQVSPKLSRSPVRSPVSPVSKASAKKKKLNLDGFDDKDFVLIKPAPKKKMVLTEHQKEIMKEKSVIPAMYNSLEHSMDASLMAAHFTTDTQMESSLSETPTPTSEPLSLFGSMIPPSNQEDTHGKLSNKKPFCRNQESKKAAKKPVHLAEKNANSETDSESGLRRSARVRDQDENSEDRWTKFRTKKEVTLSPGKTLKKNKKSKTSNNQLTCIVIDDDDDVPTDGEFGIDEDPTDSEFLENDDDSTDIDFGNDEDESIGCSLEQNFKGKIDSKKTMINVARNDFKGSADSSCKNSGSSSGGKDSGSSEQRSVPQNVLGALDFFQSLSSNQWLPKSNIEGTNFSKPVNAKDSPNREEIASTDNESDLGDSRTVVSKDVSVEQEKASSQPLQSWTQKLNELSTSPRPVSPLRKWSSQETVLSPGKKSRSLKSPKRNKKKPTDENKGKGTLEKWVIHTPGKNFQGSLNTDAVVANLSQTLVEETQSPTKFSIEQLKDKISSSIMETPPKNVLENITVSLSNSNRKLFGSQQGSGEFQFVEDSNIVPASPNSKSFRCGTPVLKLKKLTNEEIMRYSPSRRNRKESNETLDKTSESFEQTKRAIQSFEKTKWEINIGAEALNDESLHEHDDFSVFTPLETELKEKKSDGFFSKSLTDTEQAMLNFSEKNKTDKVYLYSGSENLFTQSEFEIGTNIADYSNEIATSIMNSEEAAAEKRNSESQSISTKNVKDLKETKRAGILTGTDINWEVNRSEKNDELSLPTSSLGKETGKTGGGRKRKQVAPKKLTLEEIKLKKKKDEEENRIVAKGLCRKLKEHKQHGKKKENKTRESRKGKHKKAKTSPENKTKKEKKVKKGREKKEISSRNHVRSGKGKSQQLDSTSGGSSTYTSSEENTDSSHEEIEVSVLEDMLDLEEDLHTVKTLTEIKLELKQNKQQEKKQADQPADQVVVLDKPVPVKPQENSLVLNNVNHDSNKNGMMASDENKNHAKNMNENDQVINIVPEYEDISEADTEIPFCEDDENDMHYLKNSERDILGYPEVPSELISLSEDVPYLEIEDGVPFIAVKLDEEQLHHNVEHKTDGTIGSPNADVATYYGIMGDCNESERFFPNLESVDFKLKEEQLNYKRNEQSQNEASKENDANDESFFSDDDIPIAEMKDKVLKNEMNLEQQLEIEKETVNSKQELQQSKTQFGTNEKKSEGTIKGKKIRNVKKVCAEIESDKVTQSAVSMVKSSNELDKFVEPLQQLNKDYSEKLELDKTELMNNTDRFDETPRKELDVSKSSVAVRLMMRNSDSKLTLGSRKFEKKGGAARRSILKPSQKGLLEDTDSPQRKPFHPISIGRIYSPTASPSASILKVSKRKLSEDECLETDSPPTKQRRVSFATPLADVTRVDMDRPPSPLIKMTGKNPSQESGSLTQSGKFIETQSTQGSPSQKNYESSQETQINTTDPVCPELIGCDQSVEKILPQLTASSWSKGLSNLVRARNIHTIGDLSSLTEGDIHNLPIRSPKVVTVKKVLTKFGKNIGSTRLNRQNRSSKVTLDSRLKSAGNLPEVKQLPENVPARVYNQLYSATVPEKGIEGLVDAISSSGSLLDNVNKLVSKTDQSKTDQSDGEKLTEDKPYDQSEPLAGTSKPNINLTEALLHFYDPQDIDVKNLSANELVKISQNLTGMLSEVNKAIENVVSTRCSSPWR